MRLDIDARPCALGMFALQDMWDAAAELDNLKPALDVSLAVSNHFAVLATQHMRQRVHIGPTSRLNSNITCARRCGLVIAHAG